MFFCDPFYDMIVKSEPFAVEFRVVYIMSLMDVIADMRYYGKEIVGAIAHFMAIVVDVVRCVWRHV